MGKAFTRSDVVEAAERLGFDVICTRAGHASYGQRWKLRLERTPGTGYPLHHLATRGVLYATTYSATTKGAHHRCMMALQDEAIRQVWRSEVQGQLADKCRLVGDLRGVCLDYACEFGLPVRYCEMTVSHCRHWLSHGRLVIEGCVDQVA